MSGNEDFLFEGKSLEELGLQFEGAGELRRLEECHTLGIGAEIQESASCSGN